MFPFPSIDSLVATSSTAASFISAFLPLAGWMVGVGLAGIAIAFLIGLPQELYERFVQYRQINSDDKWVKLGARMERFRQARAWHGEDRSR